jgi:aspartokinase
MAARGVAPDEIDADKFALVSVVGEALRRRPSAWQEQAQKVLADAGIEIHATARDDISLSYLVADPQRKKAVSCLHQNLVL